MPNSNIPTLDASNLTYEFESVRVKNGATNISILESVEKYSKKKLPANLQYLDDFQDKKTGTGGTAFLDKNSGEVIIAYTGTNPSADAVQDVSADFFGILMAKSYHFESAYRFYDKIRAEDGNNIIFLDRSYE